MTEELLASQKKKDCAALQFVCCCVEGSPVMKVICLAHALGWRMVPPSSGGRQGEEEIKIFFFL